MKYLAKVKWAKHPQESFMDNQYSRVHQWIMDGGAKITISSSPQVVPLPMSDESLPDPEETFIASIASCHMLFFLFIAAQQKYIVTSYEDNAEGFMQKNDLGNMMIAEINLYPRVVFGNQNTPAKAQIKHFHQMAHQKCFLANSIQSNIQIYPQ